MVFEYTKTDDYSCVRRGIWPEAPTLYSTLLQPDANGRRWVYDQVEKQWQALDEPITLSACSHQFTFNNLDCKT